MIIAVTGGKGGVGKSTVALNLARELDAVVVDGDLSTADLPRGTGPDLHDVLAGRTEPTEAIEEYWEMQLLPCGRTLEGARAANLENFEATVEMLERECNWVVIDCPAGLARDVGIEITSADVALLVTTLDEGALANAQKTRELAVRLETPIGAVVVNKADSDACSAHQSDIESRLGASVTNIPERSELAEAQESWVPVRDMASDSPVVEQFETLADRFRETERRLRTRANS